MNVSDIIKDAIYDSLEVILRDIGHKKTKVVFSDENGLEPKSTYCIVNILDRQRYGRTSESTFLTADESEMWRTEFFKICLRLSFLGESADSIAWDFDDSVPASRAFLMEFQKRNLGYIQKSKLRRVPQPRETKWMPMWNVDIDLSFAIQSRQVMDWIEFITLDGEVIRIYPEDLEQRTIDTEEFRTTEDGEIRDVYSN